MSVSTASHSPVLADVVGGTRARSAALVVAGTAFIAVASQVIIPLWFTPVPLSLSTFAVLLTGAALGPARAAMATVLYVGLGVAGAPIFAEQAAGWAFASFGYALGYIPAAILVGYLARRRADRSLLSTIAMTLLGSLVIYAVGAPWLMAFAQTEVAGAIQLGVLPFVVGDIIKAAAAALVLPTAWKLIDRNRD